MELYIANLHFLCIVCTKKRPAAAQTGRRCDVCFLSQAHPAGNYHFLNLAGTLVDLGDL